MLFDDSSREISNKIPKGLANSRKKSKSLNSLPQCHQFLSPQSLQSPKYEMQASSSKLKNIKKKLYNFTLSKSNSSISDQNGTSTESKKVQPAYSGTLVEGRSTKDLKKSLSSLKENEMRRKARGDVFINSNGTSSKPTFDQLQWPVAKTDFEDARFQSLDSGDQFVVVDTVGYDDSLDDTNSTSEQDETDGCVPAEHTTHEIERLLRKIEKTREDLMRMQATKDENVKEYLKTADITENTPNLKTKMNFEKNNLKTNTSIQVFQKKLEKYQLQLKELEERGVHGPRRIIRAVQDSVRSGASSFSEAVAKPLGSINHFIKKDKKDPNPDSISICVTYNGDDVDQSYLNNYNRMRQNTSDEDSLFNTDDPSSIALSQNQLEGSYNEDGSTRLNLHEEKIKNLEKTNEEFKKNFDLLKNEFDHVVESLQNERCKNEQLRSQLDDMFNQWNDLTELHQNEMMGLKQEMDRTAERIDCVDYRFSERSGEIEEAIDSCSTRITKMELQQHQQQQLLLSVDGYFDGNGNTKLLLSKFLSLVISIFAILLVVISTLSKIVMPFASTRMRVVTSVFTLTTVILLWKNSDHEFIQTLLYYLHEVVRPLYDRLPRDSTS